MATRVATTVLRTTAKATSAKSQIGTGLGTSTSNGWGRWALRALRVLRGPEEGALAMDDEACSPGELGEFSI